MRRLTRFNWFSAARAGQADDVSAMLERDNKFLDSTTRGCTALWIAVERGHVEVVQVLLEAGANTVRSDHASGSSPLHVAVGDIAFLVNVEIGAPPPC